MQLSMSTSYCFSVVFVFLFLLVFISALCYLDTLFLDVDLFDFVTKAALAAGASMSSNFGKKPSIFFVIYPQHRDR